MVELLGLAVGVVAGLSGGFFTAWLLYRSRTKSGASPGKTGTPSPVAPSSRVMKAELEKTKRDARMLRMDRELLSAALTRIYEAEAEGKITKDEREQISTRYREQLRGIESKTANLELIVEVGELESLRDELIGLFTAKIQQIENRLQRAQAQLVAMRGTPARQEIAPAVAPSAEVKADKAKARREGGELDEKVKALREEVLEALARLEQMDIEG